MHAEARVDLDAVRASVARLDEVSGAAAVMAVVKADGYGHGMLPCARAALSAGATWLGVAFPAEALALRAGGVTARVLALVLPHGEDLAPAVAAGVDLAVGSREQLAAVVVAADTSGRTARIHLEADTGLHRGGATAADWPGLVDAAGRAEASGAVGVVGLWSHLARADEPGHPTVDAQVVAFREAVGHAERAGLRPQVRHLANSAATLRRPDAHFDLVRPGISVYGLSPGPAVGSAASLGLSPAMTLATRVTLVKRVPAGAGVSYGHRYRTRTGTTLALIPVGYGDGVPRHAGNVVCVLADGRLLRVAGTVCMDQFMLDVGDAPVAAGDEVILFGPGRDGEPTADDWAAALGTINYEVVTRVGARVPRVYRGLP